MTRPSRSRPPVRHRIGKSVCEKSEQGRFRPPSCKQMGQPAHLVRGRTPHGRRIKNPAHVSGTVAGGCGRGFGDHLGRASRRTWGRSIGSPAGEDGLVRRSGYCRSGLQQRMAGETDPSSGTARALSPEVALHCRPRRCLPPSPEVASSGRSNSKRQRSKRGRHVSTRQREVTTCGGDTGAEVTGGSFRRIPPPAGESSQPGRPSKSALREITC